MSITTVDQNDLDLSFNHEFRSSTRFSCLSMILESQKVLYESDILQFLFSTISISIFFYVFFTQLTLFANTDLVEKIYIFLLFEPILLD